MSLGAEQAGATIEWAGNHWRFAVDVHSRAIPAAQHVCQDLRQANFHDLPDIDCILAGPACQGHSTASQPKRRRYHDKLRATAWAVVDCAEAKLPQAIVVENVRDFTRWRLYPVWKQALETLGYTLTEQMLTASRWGVPQRRSRLFVVGVRSKHPLRIREPEVVEPGIGPCIEWGSGLWHSVASKSPRVRERVEKGRRNHGARFLTQHVTGHPGVGLHEPIRTVTTKDQWAVVDGDRIRQLSLVENKRAMGFPDDYWFPEGARRKDIIRALGNAVCPPQARGIIEQVMARC